MLAQTPTGRACPVPVPCRTGPVRWTPGSIPGSAPKKQSFLQHPLSRFSQRPYPAFRLPHRVAASFFRGGHRIILVLALPTRNSVRIPSTSRTRGQIADSNHGGDPAQARASLIPTPPGEKLPSCVCDVPLRSSSCSLRDRPGAVGWAMGDLHSCGEVAGPEETDISVSSSESAEYPPPLLNSTVRKCLRSVYTSVKILQKKVWCSVAVFLLLRLNVLSSLIVQQHAMVRIRYLQGR